MPKGPLTADGLRPDFAEMFGVFEILGGGCPQRTRANVRDSDATAGSGAPDSPGGRTTLRACADLGKPAYLVIEGLAWRFILKQGDF